MFKSTYTTITSSIQNYVGKNLGWIIDLVVSHTIRDIHKIERKDCIGINIFGYENKKKYSICVSKNVR